MPATKRAAEQRTNSRKSRSEEPPEEPPSGAGLADRVARRMNSLAVEAGCADLADGAGSREIAGDTVRQFMAHQLAAGHLLTMGFTARAGRLLQDCDKGDEIARSRRALEIMRFAHGTARMMERCRAAAVALERMGYLEPPEEKPDGPTPGDGERMQQAPLRGWPLHVIGARDQERRRILDWLAQGRKLTEMPRVEDWPNYAGDGPLMPDLEKLDERLNPPTPELSSNPAGLSQVAPGLRRGRLRNGNPVGDYLTAPRCGAKTRAGCACRQPAMPSPRGSGGRCRFHGGKSTGPRTAEGLRRARTARLTHGFRTAEIIDLRAAAARVGRNLTRLAQALKQQDKQGSPQRTQRSPRDRGFDDSLLRTAPKVESARPKAAPPAVAIAANRQGCAPSSSVNSVSSVVVLSSRRRSAGHGVDRSELARAPAAAGGRGGRRRG